MQRQKRRCVCVFVFVLGGCIHLRLWLTGTRVTVTSTQLMNIHTVFLLYFSLQCEFSGTHPHKDKHTLSCAHTQWELQHLLAQTEKSGNGVKQKKREKRQEGRISSSPPLTDGGKCSLQGWPWLYTHSHALTRPGTPKVLPLYLDSFRPVILSTSVSLSLRQRACLYAVIPSLIQQESSCLREEQGRETEEWSEWEWSRW